MEIIFTNKQALLTTINKYIRFLGLDPFVNRTKEYCYRALDVVMRHYNKALFAIKRIERDSNFKSIMDKVGYDMGIEMSYANQDKKVPEAYREKW